MMFYDVIGQFPSVKRDFLLQQIPLKLLTFFLYVQSCKVLQEKGSVSSSTMYIKGERMKGEANLLPEFGLNARVSL